MSSLLAIVRRLVERPTVKVTVEQSLIFVRPPSENSGIHGEDSEVKGTVCVHLPAKRAVRSIHVVLMGFCDVYGNSRYVFRGLCSIKLFLRSHRLEVRAEHCSAPARGPRSLRRGPRSGQPRVCPTILSPRASSADRNYALRFGFRIPVPSSTAVSEELESYGRVRHRSASNVAWSCTRAELKSISIFATVHANLYLSSLAVSAVPLAIGIAAHENIPGELPETFELVVEHFTDDLGVRLVSKISEILTVLTKHLLAHGHYRLVYPARRRVPPLPLCRPPQRAESDPN